MQENHWSNIQIRYLFFMTLFARKVRLTSALLVQYPSILHAWRTHRLRYWWGIYHWETPANEQFWRSTLKSLDTSKQDECNPFLSFQPNSGGKQGQFECINHGVTELRWWQLFGYANERFKDRTLCSDIQSFADPVLPLWTMDAYIIIHLKHHRGWMQKVDLPWPSNETH